MGLDSKPSGGAGAGAGANLKDPVQEKPLQVFGNHKKMVTKRGEIVRSNNSGPTLGFISIS